MARVNIKNAVSEFLDEINGGPAEFARAYRMAVIGSKELRWDITGHIKTASLCVECDLTVKLPEDLIKVIKVGVANHNGEIATLTKNNDLSFDTGLCGKVMTEDILEYDVRNNWNDGGFNSYINQSLGRGSYNTIGEYRLSTEEGKIVLSPEFCYSEIVIEYLGSSDEDGELYINEVAAPALVAYIRWKWHVAKKGATSFDKQYYQNEYHREKQNAQMRINGPSLSDMQQNARQHTKMGIKS